MELKNYMNEINAIARANDMPWDVGKDMFVANIQNFGVDGAPYYAGADIDYAPLHTEWMAMTFEARATEKNAYDVWYREELKKRGLK